MTLPSPTDPYVLRFTGKIPSLKNDRSLVMAGSRPILAKSKAVTAFLKRIHASIAGQAARYEMIQKPYRVAMWADIRLYSANPATARASNSDADNMFTMLQEVLQSPDKPSGIAGVIEEDNQIFSGAFDLHLVNQRALEGATVYLWVSTNYRQELPEFFAWSENQYGASKLAIPIGVNDLLADSEL